MAPEFNLQFAFSLFLKYRQLQRRKLNCHLNEDFDTIITLLLRKKKKKKIKALLSIILALCHFRCGPVVRSARRKISNVGWWDRVWNTYDESRFKETFRVTRGTFLYILNEIWSSLTKESFIEGPIPPECCLAVCLYRLGRGHHMYTGTIEKYRFCQGQNFRDSKRNIVLSIYFVLVDWLLV